jgi:uncharacterized membrane protein
MSVNKKANGQYTPVRENEIVIANISALNGEAVLDMSASTGDLFGWESILSVDIRGTFVATFEVSWTIDGTNWIPLCSRSALVALTTVGTYRYNCAWYNKVRVRNTTYTSGTAIVVMTATLGMMSDRWATAVSTWLWTAAAAVTLTIPAVAGMRHYIGRVEIWRVNGTVTAVAASALLAITTTNLPANYGWNISNALAAWTHEKVVDVAFDNALVSTAVNAATTIVMPAPGAGVQWRAQVHYFLGE